MTLPRFQPNTEWRPPSLAELPSWAGAKRVAVDIETKDLALKKTGIGVRRGGYIVGVAFAIEDGPAYYLPIRHAGGGNLDPEAVLRYLKNQAAEYRGDIVGAHLAYDLDYLAEEGIEFSLARFHRDVQVAEPLLDELQMSYSLDNIAYRHGMPGKSELHLREAADVFGVDSKAGMWQLPAKHVGAYAEQDVRLPLALIRRQERRLEEEALWGVYDLESKLLPILMRYRRRGVRVSFDRLDQVEKWSIQREDEAIAEVNRLTGSRLASSDTNKVRALATVLLGLGLRLPKTAPTEKFPEGQHSIKNDWLKTVDHPVARAIVVAKKFNKLRNTFVKSIRTYAVGDRIHTTFNQLRMHKEGQEAGEDDENGPRYGRISSTDPNLQQQPSRDPEIGKPWRSIFLPDEGAQWASCDYSQQEPRWLTHFAALVKCTRADEARQRYIDDPKTDNHQMMAELCEIDRKPAKEIYLGLCYGMGSAKLARKLGLPTQWIPHWRTGAMIEVAGPEAQAILDKFNDRAPFVRELAKRLELCAKENGYIRTVSRRKCRFPQRPDGSYEYVHKGLNRLIQGSSGDQTKQAMVAAEEASIAVQLQVHDELDTSVEGRARAEELAAVMRECTPCTVPAKVDVEVGPSWGEAA